MACKRILRYFRVPLLVVSYGSGGVVLDVFIFTSKRGTILVVLMLLVGWRLRILALTGMVFPIWYKRWLRLRTTHKR